MKCSLIFLVLGTALTGWFVHWTHSTYWLLGEVLVLVIFFGLLEFERSLDE